MYLSNEYRTRSLIERLFNHQYERIDILYSSSRRYIPLYITCAICIMIIYYLNILIGFKYYIWSEKSFDVEYHLSMIHIDPIKIKENPENILGPAKYILSNQFI